jgi:hypothetical protein
MAWTIKCREAESESEAYRRIMISYQSLHGRLLIILKFRSYSCHTVLVFYFVFSYLFVLLISSVLVNSRINPCTVLFKL